MNTACDKPQPVLLRIIATLLALQLACPAPALLAASGVVNGNVVAGNASFNNTTNRTTITAADKTIIEYNRFNIGAGQTVEFIQPGANSRVLNRVTGNDPSHILGNLTANGIVYLVNPSGIYFGQGATIDVGQLYAAAGSLSNSDFLAQNNHFTDLLGPVVNAGSLVGDSIHLLGKHVANSGTINALQGVVVMAAGDDIYIGRRGEHLYVRTAATEPAAPGTGTPASPAPGIENTGTIAAARSGPDAARGKILLAAGDLYSIAIRQSGILRASDVRLEGQASGEVWNNGTIDVSSATGNGGYARVTGQHVGLGTASVIDASGATGGGGIHVGGGYQGNSPDIRNADATYVAKGASLKADATNSGSGGTIIVWSDGVTRYQGNISATGITGPGGFAEVSGKKYLAFDGAADLRSAFGPAGTLLLDPDDITISTGADNNISGLSPFAATDTDNPANLNVTTLTNALASSNVTVQTSNGGNITVGSAITWDSPSTLALDGTSVFINAPITASNGTLDFGSGSVQNLAIRADVTVDVLYFPFALTSTILGDASAPLVTITTTNSQYWWSGITLAGNVSLNTTDTVTGNITFSDAVSSGTGADLTLNSGSINLRAITGIGDLTIITPSTGISTVAINDNISADSLDITGSIYGNQNITINTTGSQTYRDDIRIEGSHSLVLTAGDDIWLQGNISGNTGATFTLTAANDIIVDGDADGAGDNTYAFTARTITQDTGSTIQAANLTFNTTSGGAAGLTTINGIVSTDTSGSITVMGGLTLASGAGLFLGNTDTTWTLDAAGGDMTFNSSAIGNGIYTADPSPTLLHTLTINNANSITLNAPIATSGDQTYNGQTIRINAALTSVDGDLIFNAASGSGPITINAGSAISIMGSQIYNGAVTLGQNTTLSGATITFDGTIAGAGHTLSTTTTDSTSFNGSVSGLSFLSATGPAVINASSIQTSGTQTYGGAVTLASSTTLNATGITFDSTLASSTGAGLTAANASGATVFNGAVSGLSSLNLAGTATINASSIQTTGTQVYGNPVVLTTTTSLGASSITFNGSLSSSTTASLTVTATGNTTFNNSVSGLGSLLVNGPSNINTTSIQTDLDQTYNGPVTLFANATLTAFAINFDSTLSSLSGASLTTNSTSATVFDGNISGLGSLTVDGNAIINAASVRTIGAQIYDDPVTINSNTTLEASSVTFVDSLSAFGDVTIRTTGSQTYGGDVYAEGGRTMVLDAGDDIWLQDSISGNDNTTFNLTATNDIIVDGNVGRSYGSSTYIFTARTITQDANSLIQASNLVFETISGGAAGLTTFNGIVSTDTSGSIAITGGLTLGTGAMLFLGDATTAWTLSASGGNVTFNSGAIGSGTLPPPNGAMPNPAPLDSLMIIDAGTIVLNASIATSGNQTYNGQNIQINAAPGSVSGSLLFNTPSGNGPITINTGSAINTTGDQTYNGAVALAQNTSLSGANITFGNTIVGTASSLTTTATGSTTLNAGVSGLSSLTINGPATINVPSTIQTTGAQLYNGPVELLTDTSLNASSITFGDSVTSVSHASLAVSTTDSTTFNGDVTALTSLNVTGLAVINASGIQTSDTQSYGGPVTLTSDVSLDAASIVFDSTITASGSASLTVSSATATTFNGGVSGLSSLDVTGGSVINATSIQTTGTQIYHDTVTLGSDTSLSASSITFSGTVDSATNASLTTTATTSTTFNGDVSGISSLDVTGPVVINTTSIQTLGTQIYRGSAALARNANLGGSGITFDDTIMGGGCSLSTTATGPTTINGNVSGLSSLAIVGSAIIEAANIQTTGAQIYNGPVTLASDTSLNASYITFDSTLSSSSGHGLTTTTTDATVFNGNVSGLGILTVNGPGTINTASIQTDGTQSYNGPLALFAGTSLNSTSSISFGGTISASDSSLAVTTSDGTAFNGTVSGLSLLTVNGPATINTAGIQTSGNQTWNGYVMLSANATLSSGAGNISFADELYSTGDARSLTVTADAGTLTIAQLYQLNDVSLSATAIDLTGDIDTSGTLDIRSTNALGLNVAIQTTGAQTYTTSNADITLGASASLVTLGSGSDITFSMATTPAPGATTGYLNLLTTGAAITTASDAGINIDGGFHYNVGNPGAIAAPGGLNIDALGRHVLIDQAINLISISTSNTGDIRATNVITTGDQNWGIGRGYAMEIAGNGLTSTNGSINIAGNNASMPGYATIYSTSPQGLRINAAQSITTGRYDTLLAYDGGSSEANAGSITIATGGGGRLGDMTASNAITIHAQALQLRGNRYQAARITFSATTLSIDNGNSNPVIIATAAAGASVPADPLLTLQTIAPENIGTDGRIIPGLFPTAGASPASGHVLNPYQRTPFGNSVTETDVISNTVASNTPDNQATPEIQATEQLFVQLIMGLTKAQIDNSTTIDSALRDELVKLGIFARGLTLDETASRDAARALYRQLIATNVRTPEMYKVADGRISAAAARNAVALYYQTFTRPGPDDTHIPILPEIQKALETSFRTWRTSNAEAKPDAFPAWLLAQSATSDANARALQQFFQDAAHLFRVIEAMGLTPQEILVSKTVLLRSLRVTGLPARIVRDMIENTPPTATNPAQLQLTAQL